jgi:tRNA (adenine37-N6)-methyltransferase
MPLQPTGAIGVKGQIKVNENYKDGLKDLEGFSHIILIYHFHLCNGYSLDVETFSDNKRGIFATRVPKRPNPIGLSVVKLEKIEGNIINISNLDMVDGTPLLDIKPYIPQFDKYEEVCLGWFEDKDHHAKTKNSDKRFVDD